MSPSSVYLFKKSLQGTYEERDLEPEYTLLVLTVQQEYGK